MAAINCGELCEFLWTGGAGEKRQEDARARTGHRAREKFDFSAASLTYSPITQYRLPWRYQIMSSSALPKSNPPSNRSRLAQAGFQAVLYIQPGAPRSPTDVTQAERPDISSPKRLRNTLLPGANHGVSPQAATGRSHNEVLVQ